MQTSYQLLSLSHLYRALCERTCFSIENVFHIDPVLVLDSDYCKHTGPTKRKIGKHSWTCRWWGLSHWHNFFAMFELTRPVWVRDMIWPTPLLSVSQSSHPSAHIKGGRRAEEEEKVRVSSEPTWIIGCIPDLLDFQDIINDMGYLGLNCHCTLLTFASQPGAWRVQIPFAKSWVEWK